MSPAAIRFIHSSDWQLESSIAGVADVPTALREPFVDAPYQAAERVVQAALDQRVDFLLLTGDLLPIDTACPYTFEFLLRQFERLGEQSIAVYWLGAAADDIDYWPTALSLPAHVHCFPTGQVHSFDHLRDGKPVARLIGHAVSSGGRWTATEFAGGDGHLPRIALASGTAQKSSLENKGIDYWALGGEARHHVLLHGTSTAAYAGSPQGRSADDTDAHGAVLVELRSGRATMQLIETDLWRWRRERVLATDVTTLAELQDQLARQLTQIPLDAQRFGWLLVWSVVCPGQLSWQLAQPETRASLIDALRQQTSAVGARWSMALETEPGELPAEWYDEDTVLGDYLRAALRYEQQPDGWQELATYLPEGLVSDELLRELQQLTDSERQRLWRQVACWGADLLRGEIALEESAG